VSASPEGASPAGPAPLPDRARRLRAAGRRRWAAGLVVALGFHVALIALTRVQVAPRVRTDRIDTRIGWVGDRAVLEEDTLQGQQLRIFNDAPLFLPTSQNFASTRRSGEGTRRPGDIFTSFDPILVMPPEGTPAGLVVAPVDRADPVSALRGFRWPYHTRFGRADPLERRFEARRARIEVRSLETGGLVLEESLPASAAPGDVDGWPDWRPFEMLITMSHGARLSEPIMIGGGSGSDRVDQAMREHVRRRMRLDLRLGPGSYRVGVGP
jgi:hypothetical protein